MFELTDVVSVATCGLANTYCGSGVELQKLEYRIDEETLDELAFR